VGKEAASRRLQKKQQPTGKAGGGAPAAADCALMLCNSLLDA
jgi:hypothetical protein